MHNAQNAMSKHWCFTINNPSVSDLPPPELLTYIVYGEEVGTDGTPHYQGYVCFINRKRFSTVKNHMPRAHLERMKGTPFEASEYCKKDGNYHESGELPKGPSLRMKRNWEEAFDLAKEGKFEEIPRNLLVPYYHAFKRIFQDNPPQVDDNDHTCGFWVWGRTGFGKSDLAKQLCPKAFKKRKNKWWDGYKGEPNVIIEDVGRFQVTHGFSDDLKEFADHYAYPVEHKGTTVLIRPKRIIVTSQYSIEDLWGYGPDGDPEVVEALSRRYEQYHLTEKTARALIFENQRKHNPPRTISQHISDVQGNSSEEEEDSSSDLETLCAERKI